MAEKKQQLTREEVLALLFDSFSSGNEVHINQEKSEDLDGSGPEKEGNDIDLGQQTEEATTSKASRAASDPDSSSESELDDTGLDEDYRPEKDDSPDNGSDTDTAQHIEGEKGTALGTSVVRHKHPRPHLWKRKVIKEKRLKGESYKNKMGQERPPKTMGLPCTSQHCLKSSKRSCELLTEEQRKDIFNNFWSMPSWETRKLYIQTLVENVPIKQKKGGAESRRTTSLLYHLQLRDGCKLPVCKNLFCSTFGIAPRTIGSWLIMDKKSKTDPCKPKINNTGPHMPISDVDQAFLKEWLSGLPTVPSHYCRKVPSYQDKKFLEPGTAVSDLHKEYQKAAGEKGRRATSETYFRNVFSEQNYSVFIPKKDQCDVCVSAKAGNTDQDTLTTHLKLKDQAQAEKAIDKKKSSDKLSVWAMDLQCVLLCPQTKASTMYYKTKLQMHNFTCFNLNNKDGYCYAWEEHEGSLNSAVFAHLQSRHFEQILEANRNIEKVIVWSDGCGYQNRCATISNTYLHLAMKHGVTIEQKFLVAGHTQMECDSMHSVIERRIIKDIHTPRDYIVIFETARMHPSPYKVTQLYHNDFMKLSGAYVTNIRPGKKVGDPTVHDLRALQYLAEGLIRYKLDFESDWEDLPHRISICQEKTLHWVPLFSAQLPITGRKYNDLQSMKPVLPRVAHQYYDNLPHQ